MLQSPLAFNHHLLATHLKPRDCVIDATIGNGHDSLFLKQHIGREGHLYGFDIQEQAITQTTNRLKKADCLHNVTLIQAGHEQMQAHISANETISAIVFNLGYLPSADKSIITTPDTTIAALEQSLQLIKPGGIVTVMIYYGHDGGQAEKETVLSFFQALDQQAFSVICYRPLNQVNQPPFLIAAEKL